MTAGVRRKSIRRFTARRISLAPALAVIAIFLPASAGSHKALAQINQAHTRTWVCPERYSLIHVQPPYCFSDAGDITEPTVIYRAAAVSWCRQGYDRFGTLCFSPATGDVELAETPADRHALR